MPSVIEAKLQNEINRCNEATGAADTTLHAAITSLIAGFGSGAGEENATPETTHMMSGSFTISDNMTSGHQLIAYIEPWGWTPSVVVAWRMERTYTAKMVIASALFDMSGNFVRICAVGNSTGTGLSGAVSINDWTSIDQGYICLEYGNTLYLRAGTTRGLQAGEWHWLAVE